MVRRLGGIKDYDGLALGRNSSNEGEGRELSWYSEADPWELLSESSFIVEMEDI